MKRKFLLAFCCVFLVFNVLAQNKTRFPIWTYHDTDVIINGLSVGAFTKTDTIKNVITNGFRLEIPGFPFTKSTMSKHPIIHSDELLELVTQTNSENINGISFSILGNFLDGDVNGFMINCFLGNCCRLNGVSLGGALSGASICNGLQIAFLGTSAYKCNGVQIAFCNEADNLKGLQLGGLMNIAKDTKGVQISLFNDSRKHIQGVQIGFVNKAKNLKGIQFGLWNVNQKRKLPIINWSF